MPRLVSSNIRLEDAVERYLSRIRNEQKSPASVNANAWQLKRLIEALDNPWVHSITFEVIDNYCFGKGGIRLEVGGNSFNGYRAILNGFFEYALVMRWTDDNPVKSIPRAKPDTPRQRLRMGATELLALLEPPFSETPLERWACALGMNTGLRANDIRHLRIFDASLATGGIQTEIRKTRKLDVKPITLDLHRELVLWLDEYAALMNLPGREHLDNSWYLVPANRPPAPRERDRRIHLKPAVMFMNPWRLVQAPLRRMGYPTHYEGFHTLRRNSARALFESLRDGGEGRDHALRIVQDYLNHAHSSQTEHYLGLEPERAIRDALLKGKPFLSQVRQTEQARVSAGETSKLRELG